MSFRLSKQSWIDACRAGLPGRNQTPKPVLRVLYLTLRGLTLGCVTPGSRVRSHVVDRELGANVDPPRVARAGAVERLYLRCERVKAVLLLEGARVTKWEILKGVDNFVTHPRCMRSDHKIEFPGIEFLRAQGYQVQLYNVACLPLSRAAAATNDSDITALERCCLAIKGIKAF